MYFNMDHKEGFEQVYQCQCKAVFPESRVETIKTRCGDRILRCPVCGSQEIRCIGDNRDAILEK